MSLRLVKYCAVGLIPFAANYSTYKLLLHFGISLGFAIGIGFFIGGQVAFWSHDRLTFGDRHISLKGWTRRWRRFMPGQFAGFMLNQLATNSLVEFSPAPPHVVFAAATAAGVLGTFSWTNWFSHKRHPAEPANEQSQE